MNLTARRKEIGLTSAEAAKRLGICQAYLSLIETGRRKINPSRIKEFAKVYKVNHDQIQRATIDLCQLAKSKCWLNQIKINDQPLRNAFLQELKYLPLKNKDDSMELEFRLINFIDKNIVHSIKKELNQDKQLLYYFIE